MPLESDMAGIILPEKYMSKTMSDPFGLKAILYNESYPNPNRYFVQYFMSAYFLNMPLILQHWVDPIESVYLSCALIKIILQAGIMVLLAFYIKQFFLNRQNKILLAILLVLPLFQTEGYNRYMGIIDPSITYSLNYALPLCLLLLLIFPFYKNFYIDKKYKLNTGLKIFIVFLSIIVMFSGPLTPGIILIISFLYYTNRLYHNYKNTIHPLWRQRIIVSFKKIPKDVTLFFIFFSFLSFYSIFLGMHNSLFSQSEIPIVDRYLKIPAGLYYLVSQKIGYPLFLAMIGINLFIIKKNLNNEFGRKIINFSKWVGVFSLLYILLLPLGGYRDYRPNIIRYDTIMPVTICLMLLYGISTYHLINSIKKFRLIYILVILAFSFVFINANESHFDNNLCEIQALRKIAESPKNIVQLDCDCTVMGWDKITCYKDSELNAELLQIWHITKSKKLYFQ